MNYDIKIGKDFFIIDKTKNGKYKIDEIINNFNIFNYKYIYKSSQNFRTISKDELLKENYSSYHFTDVDYTEHFIIINPLIKFFHKSLPKLKYLKKIKMK